MPNRAGGTARPGGDPSGRYRVDMTRALPEPDLHALFAVLLAVHGALSWDELPDEMYERLAGRLAQDGLLPADATKGQLNALLADLAQRMHWAMGVGEEYPQPIPPGVVHAVVMPGGEADAEAFASAAAALGGRDVWARPGRTAWTVLADGRRRPTDPPGTWLVAVTFDEMPPDEDFRAREAELTVLAERHGGRYSGHHR